MADTTLRVADAIVSYLSRLVDENGDPLVGGALSVPGYGSVLGFAPALESVREELPLVRVEDESRMGPAALAFARLRPGAFLACIGASERLMAAAGAAAVARVPMLLLVTEETPGVLEPVVSAYARIESAAQSVSTVEQALLALRGQGGAACVVVPDAIRETEAPFETSDRNRTLGSLTPEGVSLTETVRSSAAPEPYGDRTPTDEELWGSIDAIVPPELVFIALEAKLVRAGHRVLRPERRRHLDGGAAPVGHTIAAAIGARLALPGTRIVAVVSSDGGPLTGSDLATVARQALGLILVFVDRGATFSDLERFDDAGDTAQHAAALGLGFARCSTEAEFATALAQAIAAPEAAVIEVVAPVAQSDQAFD
ncbi:MAG: thiamine pyrophosphate-dependent enzyme [Myxococcota bacterium]